MAHWRFAILSFIDWCITFYLNFHILGAFICKLSYFSHGVKLTFGCVCLAKKVEREKYKDINNVKKYYNFLFDWS